MWRLVQAVRQGRFATRDRVRGYARVLLAFEVAAFVFFVAGTHGWIVKLDQPVSSDFVSFYAAGALADEGTPALAYDEAAHYAREQQATEPGIAYNFFYYPPVFLLLCAALAKLPYLAAFISFQLACLLPCLALARRITGPIAPSTLLAFPAVFWSVGSGQNGLLTAALLAGATLAIDRRPILAGMLIGALCYKPHFGLLLPAALAAGGHWRAFATAAATTVGLVLASVVVFGWATWQAFLNATAGAGAVYGMSHVGIDVAGLTSVYGLVLSLGGSPAQAIALQSPVTIGALLTVTWVWTRRASLAGRSAVLLAAMPVAVPIFMFYDLILTGLALAWMVRDGRERGFPPWQMTGIAVTFLLPLMTGNIGSEGQIGMPPLTALLGFVLALRQTIQIIPWEKPATVTGPAALAP